MNRYHQYHAGPIGVGADGIKESEHGEVLVPGFSHRSVIYRRLSEQPGRAGCNARSSLCVCPRVYVCVRARESPATGASRTEVKCEGRLETRSQHRAQVARTVEARTLV